MKDTMNDVKVAAASLTLVFALGCQVSSSLGMTPDQTGVGGGIVMPLPVAPADPEFSYPEGVSGNWTGYFQGAPYLRFDAIALSLGKTTEGNNEIRVVLGVDPPPPPPTNASAIWPPSQIYDSPKLISGISYVAHQVQWQGNRLTFRLAAYEAFNAWCDLQAAVYPLFCDGSGSTCTTCDPFRGDDPRGECWAIDKPSFKVSCSQGSLCFGFPCVCNGLACTGNIERNVAFDVTFDSGTAASGVALNASLRLVR